MTKFIKPVFTEEGHRYDSSLGRYTSATTRIHSLEPEEDWDAIAQKYLDKRTYSEIIVDLMVKQSKTREQVLAMIDGRQLNVKTIQHIWKIYSGEACEKGSTEHARRENRDLSTEIHEIRGMTIPIGINPKPIVDYYNDLPDGLYPELLLWDNESMTSGTADLVTIKTIDGVRYAWVDDYKGFSLDTIIPTETGFTTMGEIKVGDKVFDGNGKITEVEHVSMIHYNPCYEITFDTNDKVLCDEDHKWVVGVRQHGRLSKECDMLTHEMYNLYNTNDTCLTVKVVSLDINKDVELPIDPYVLGLWLGDGTASCGMITSMNVDTWKEVKKRGYEVGGKSGINSGKADTKTIFGIYTQLREMNLLNNKHIPDIYLRSSHKQRLDLLRGFMDADGHFHRKRSRCVMVTTKDWQKEALVTLTASLGMKPTAIKAKTTGFSKINVPCWHINFTTTVSPFLSRNLDYEELMSTKPDKYNKVRYIKSIVKVDTVPTKCIAVKSEDKTYLVTKSYIKTHNTNKEIKDYNYIDKRTGNKVVNKYMLYPFGNLCNCNYWHYQIQLNMYGYMLRKFGFTFMGGDIIHTEDDDKRYPLQNLQDQVHSAFEMWRV